MVLELKSQNMTEVKFGPRIRSACEKQLFGNTTVFPEEAFAKFVAEEGSSL